MEPKEAYGAVAGEMYVPGEDHYEAPAQVLAGLDPEVVSTAKAYADENDLPWPPVASGGIMMEVRSL